jgi:acetyl-CoA carboxylase biotin carboxyl carrier protein
VFNRRFLETLNELIDLVGKDSVREIEVERGFFRSRIRVAGAAPESGPRPDLAPAPAPVPVAPESESDVDGGEAQADTDGLHAVLSPLVGLFYRASAPDVPPFVEEGDMVRPGQTLCVIETMKIMNEIESDVEGRVSRIMVENGQPVEYNTPLFLIEPQ